ncbi:peroxidase [Favolaschia claudopus]|uniref:Peroxidase n=1 Tax=Favolaschia claudopus TaxID=2862362 RepID=A0AAW0DLB0_9AGAR
METHSSSIYLSSLLLLLSSLSPSVDAYTWPSPQLDALEQVRWEQIGLTAFLQPCNTFSFDPQRARSGRSNAADWIRTAYHDMATFNIGDGTGGLDGSIRFEEEQARAENVGDGFKNTFSAIGGTSNRYVSIADAVAVAAVLSFSNCGGPEIPFRGGRVDAIEPNAPGVPEPQDSLDSHISSFARQGFTKEEMIGLVACGHSFGSVQHASFPNIAPEVDDPNNTQSNAHFDTTPATFDNNIATEYMTGTTVNPLVVGLNETTNSDKRIFGSDGNVTMRSFADSPEVFASTCAHLMARMIDTVPAGTKLTEVVTPLPVKPSNLDLLLVGDKIQLDGQVRFWNMIEDSSRRVRLLWDDHNGSNSASNNATLRFSRVGTSSGGRNRFAFYSFSPDTGSTGPTIMALDAVAGITNMRFAVDSKIEDQGGLGFPVMDDIMFASTSCYRGTRTNVTGGRIDIAVRNDANPTRIYLERSGRDSTGRPTIQEIDVPIPKITVPSGSSAYSIWSYELPTDSASIFASYNIGAEVGGVKSPRSGFRRSIDQLEACV